MPHSSHSTQRFKTHTSCTLLTTNIMRCVLLLLMLHRVAAVLGEFGVKDHGSDDVADANGDSTNIAEVDAKFLSDLSTYTKQIEAKSGNGVSWFVWSWNANSRE